MVAFKIYAAAMLPVLTMATPVLADPGPGSGGWHMWGGGWHGSGVGPLMMVLIVMIAVLLVAFAVRRMGGGDAPDQGGPRPPADTALDILRRRFARGEIDQAEFDARRRVLDA